MMIQATRIPCRHAAQAPRGRLSLVRRLALVSALIGGVGLGLAVRSNTPSAPATATHSTALAVISPSANEGGPWIP